MTTGDTRLITEEDIEFRTAFAGKDWAVKKRALLDQHKEVMRGVRAAHGCPEAEAAVEAAMKLIDGIEAAILAIPAQGITGVLIKMTVSRHYSSEIGDHAGTVLQAAYEDAERLAGCKAAVQS
jgi:limonene-1,2-epoxide hydrolase